MWLELFSLAFLVVFLFLAYAGRTCDQLPSNWNELRTEIGLQWIARRCVAEDIWLRKRNRTELYEQPHKVAVISGGNRGIGLEVVKQLVRCQMTVVVGVRRPEEAQEGIKEFLKDFKDAKVVYERLDAGDMKSVREFAAKVQRNFPKIHILINNAGIMCTPFKLTEDGFETQMAVNLHGGFLLSHLLLPQLKAAGDDGEECARIVSVCSCVAYVGEVNWLDLNFNLTKYFPSTSYAQSKLMQLMCTNHLNKTLVDANIKIRALSVHPGMVNTELFQNSKIGSMPYLRRLFFKTPSKGARVIVHAAIAKKLEGKGAIFLSNCVRVRQPGFAKDPDLCESAFQMTKNGLGIGKFLGDLKDGK